MVVIIKTEELYDKTKRKNMLCTMLPDSHRMSRRVSLHFAPFGTAVRVTPMNIPSYWTKFGGLKERVTTIDVISILVLGFGKTILKE